MPSELCELYEERISILKEAFSIFDLDGDGTITIEEMSKVMTSLGRNFTHSQIFDIVSELSPDGSWTIDFPAFHMIVHKIIESAGEEEIREAFRMFDKDDNGFISPSELRYVMGKLGANLSHFEVEEMISIADANQDGQMDYEEFVKMFDLLNTYSLPGKQGTAASGARRPRLSHFYGLNR